MTNRGPASARKRAQLAEEEDRISFEWIVMKLVDEAHAIRAGLEEIQALGSPDISACITLWSLQFQGFQLLAGGHPDPSVRERFEAALEQRRRLMNAVLAKARGSEKFAEIWPVLGEKKANGHG